MIIMQKEADVGNIQESSEETEKMLWARGEYFEHKLGFEKSTLIMQKKKKIVWPKIGQEFKIMQIKIWIMRYYRVKVSLKKAVEKQAYVRKSRR